jgi:hypothetical protein
MGTPLSVRRAIIRAGLVACALATSSLALGFGAVVHARASAGSQQPPACRRAPARQWTEGEVFVIRDPVTPPCVLSFRDTPIALVTDGQHVAEMSERVVRDRRGRFYAITSTVQITGQISVWNPDGTFRESFGRRGQGPGEFAGAVMIHPTASGLIYIFDNGRRWSVFDSSYHFVRVDVTDIWPGQTETAALDDGTFLGAVRPRDTAYSFDIKRPLGDSSTALAAAGGARGGGLPPVVRSFGELRPSETAISQSSRRRLIAYSGGQQFWAGPPAATGRGYEIELWNTSGKLLRTIRREVPWYPSGVDVEKPRQPQQAPPVPPGRVGAVYSMGDGLVFVAIGMTNPRGWAAALQAPADTTLRFRAYEAYWELIDGNSGTVLARNGPIGYEEANRTLPAGGWFQGSQSGYKPFDTPGGEHGVRIVEMVLRGK